MGGTGKRTIAKRESERETRRKRRGENNNRVLGANLRRDPVEDIPLHGRGRVGTLAGNAAEILIHFVCSLLGQIDTLCPCYLRYLMQCRVELQHNQTRGSVIVLAYVRGGGNLPIHLFLEAG